VAAKAEHDAAARLAQYATPAVIPMQPANSPADAAADAPAEQPEVVA
jgi:hypothetical protein